jgi:prolyl 4-hydroxylase
MLSDIAFDLSTEDGRRFAANGGQRTVTVLIYLNDVMRGGATRFPALNLDIQPRRGMALVFFPATVDGMLDKMALHAALPAIDTKFVSQVWIRQSTYNGQPSKRLQQTLGAPISLQIDPAVVQHNHPRQQSTTADIFWQQSQSTVRMHF